MKCIAIDDEPLALKLLTRYCSQVPSIRLLGAFTDPLEGVSYIRSTRPDLIFLDIRMPDISGINITRLFEESALVILTTAHKEYAVEGFELNVVDYLLKPFSFERFLRAYNKAEQRFLSSSAPRVAEQATGDRTIFIKYNYRNIQIPLHAILYIEAFDNSVKIITRDKTYMPVMTMKTLLRLLPADEFLRVHKSFIVSVGKIVSFNNRQIIVDRKKLPIGRHYRGEFLEKMNILKRGDGSFTPIF
jgi:DNA-binding LytR/AlgR family response regulator